MTISLLELDAFSSDLRADYERATYFTLEAVAARSDCTELLLLEEAEDQGFYALSIGLPDRPALTKTWTFADFADAVAALQELRNLRPDARLFVTVWLDQHGLEIVGGDVLRGVIEAQAARAESPEWCEWTWLAEEAAGTRPPQARDYSPFFASIAQALA